MSRETTWRNLCVQADPEFNRTSRLVIEYEFSAPGGKIGNERTHEAGRRIFLGDYQTRGPYTPVVVGDNDLTWNGIPINWNGDTLSWDS